MRAFRAVLLLLAVAAVAECVRSAPADEVHVDTEDLAPGEPHSKTAIGEAGPVGEHGEDHGGRNYNQPPLLFEPQLAIWSLVLFGVFLVVAKRLAWRPLMDGLTAREERVNRALAEAEAARRRAAQLILEHEERIGAATDEVRGIVGSARREAEQSKIEIIAAAEREAEQIRDRALADIRAAREQLLAELAATVDRYAETTSDRLLEGIRS